MKKGIFSLSLVVLLSALLSFATPSGANGVEGAWVEATFSDNTEVSYMCVYPFARGYEAETAAVEGAGLSVAAPIVGKVQSFETGCVEPVWPCPVAARTKIDCNVDAEGSWFEEECCAFFRQGTYVTLAGKPTTGNAFAGWYYSGNYGKDYSTALGNLRMPVVDEGSFALAYFAPASTTYPLGVEFDGQGDFTGARVVSNPAGINCLGQAFDKVGDFTGFVPDGCYSEFRVGTTVRLQAIGTTKARLMFWYGDSASSIPWADMQVPIWTCAGPGGCSVPMTYCNTNDCSGDWWSMLK